MIPVRISRRRRVRHAELNGTVRGSAGIKRLKRLFAWTSDRASTLSGTGSAQTFTADAGTDVITITAHGFADGDGPFEVSNAGGALPAGLVEGTRYWVSETGVNTLQLHLSRKEALQSLNPVNFTDNGTGTQTLTPSETDKAMEDHLRRYGPAQVQAATDVDDLV